MSMSKLRCLTIFSSAVINSMPSLSCYHLLRVLDLEGCNLKKHPCMGFVGSLSHLRYLGLSNARYVGVLPVEIRKLQFLQTLDLHGTNVEDLPSSIVELRKLMCLCVEDGTRLPDGLRNLTSLEVLKWVCVKSTCIAEDLGHLTKLRELMVSLTVDEEGRWNDRRYKPLLESLCKLHKLQTLVIIFDGKVASLSSLLQAPINPASFLFLSYLDIKLYFVRRDDIQVLGMLPALRYLEVKVSGDDIQVLQRFGVGHHAFPCATTCKFFNFATVPYMFPPCAMPRLEELNFCIDLEEFCNGEFTVDDLALGHLPSLCSVDLWLYGTHTVNRGAMTKVEEQLRHEAEVHPNRPCIDIKVFNNFPFLTGHGSSSH